MPRYFERISEAQLIIMIDNAVTAYGPNKRRCWRDLTPQIKKDLSKCRFDLENVDDGGHFGKADIVGYHTLPNGLIFKGLCAGGDWEVPVHFIIYWDGTQLRGYIPKDGNPWNTTSGYPYGNDDDADGRNLKKRYPERFVGMKFYECDSSGIYPDAELMKQDIMGRIVER